MQCISHCHAFDFHLILIIIEISPSFPPQMRQSKLRNEATCLRSLTPFSSRVEAHPNLSQLKNKIKSVLFSPYAPASLSLFRHKEALSESSSHSPSPLFALCTAKAPCLRNAVCGAGRTQAEGSHLGGAQAPSPGGGDRRGSCAAIKHNSRV